MLLQCFCTSSCIIHQVKLGIQANTVIGIEILFLYFYHSGLTAADLRTEVGKNTQREMKVMGLNKVVERLIEKIIDLSAICDIESKLNSNSSAKYLSPTVGLYANP